ncbi:cGMP-specific 3',5'-cyclic phosphodiesterase [Eumeta japonica]|uniref:cGMP-specific 3',5'-cyclic phosphodiesterase n=1 Tax=Eumeta variegata TaxID=151549 RepID=A0A4C1SFD5_EUMVA|nr:cGMP-specific 3',5'-cyclic phosphodiesterase [Eumeta japonica]
MARSQEIRIPFGVGVAGLAAQTKHPINIKNAYADPRHTLQQLHSNKMQSFKGRTDERADDATFGKLRIQDLKSIERL